MISVFALLQGSIWQLLGNNTVQFVVTIAVTVVLGLGSLFLPGLISRTRKELWYRVGSWPVLNPSEKELNLEVRRGDELLNNANIVICAVRYAGNRALEPEGLSTPITFDFPDDVRVVSAKVVHTSSPGANIEAVIEPPDAEGVVDASWPHMVTLTNDVWNDGDWVRARMLVDKSAGLPEVYARGPNLSRTRDESKYRSPYTYITISLAILGIILIYANIFFDTSIYLLWAGTSLTFVAGIAGPIFTSRRSRLEVQRETDVN